MILLPAIKHLGRVLKHKWFVLIYGLKLRVNLWRLLKHDLSKLSRHEWLPYAKQFFGDGEEPMRMAKAWLHHQNHNDHHWEYWITRTSHLNTPAVIEDITPLDMPEQAIREMVADWLGASRTYSGIDPKSKREWPWYLKHKSKIEEGISLKTASMANQIIDEYFSEWSKS
jgi:hypothetical protein